MNTAPIDIRDWLTNTPKPPLLARISTSIAARLHDLGRCDYRVRISARMRGCSMCTQTRNVR